MFRYALRRALTQQLRGVRRSLPDRSQPLPSFRRHIHDLTGVASFPRANDVSMVNNDTIYALSSGAGRAGIAVIRISGPGCLDVCFHMFISHGLFAAPFLTSCRFTGASARRKPHRNPDMPV